MLVAANGVAKLADFGVAKARGRASTTGTGEVKGKLAYMSPEQFAGAATRQSDFFSVAVVLWEALTGHRLFGGETDAEVVRQVLYDPIPSPNRHPELDAVVIRGLARDPAERHTTALEFAAAVEAAVRPASAMDVARWLDIVAGDRLAARAARLEQLDAIASSGDRTRPVSGLAVAPPPKRRRALVVAVVALAALAPVVGFGALRARRQPPAAIAPRSRTRARTATPRSRACRATTTSSRCSPPRAT